MLDRLSRLAPLTGAVFSVLAAVAFASAQPPPGEKATGASVIAYFKAHSTGQQTSDYLWFVAFTFLLFFAGSLRNFLRRVPAADALGPLVLVGAAVLAVGAAVYFGMDYTAAVVPDRLDPAAAQTLNLLALKLVFPFAVGACVFGIAAGLAILRGRQLPTWLGWFAIVIGVVSVTPLALGAVVLLILWTAVVSVLVYRRGGTQPL